MLLSNVSDRGQQCSVVCVRVLVCVCASVCVCERDTLCVCLRVDSPHRRVTLDPRLKLFDPFILSEVRRRRWERRALPETTAGAESDGG